MLLLLLMPAQCMMVRAAAVLASLLWGRPFLPRMCVLAAHVQQSVECVQCSVCSASLLLAVLAQWWWAVAALQGVCQAGRQAGLVCQLSCNTCMAAAALVCCPGVVGPYVSLCIVCAALLLACAVCSFAPGQHRHQVQLIICSWAGNLLDLPGVYWCRATSVLQLLMVSFVVGQVQCSRQCQMLLLCAD